MDHAWNERDQQTGDLKHRQEFIDKGIQTQAELREIVTNGIEHQDTRAFHAQPSIEQGKAMGRELYGIPLADNKGQSYELIVVLNPDTKDGRLLGGTCFVPTVPQYFEKQLARDVERLQQAAPTGSTVDPQSVVVMGGRPALREQDSHRQLVAVENQTKREPTMVEKIQERQKAQGRDQPPVPQPKPPTLDR